MLCADSLHYAVMAPTVSESVFRYLCPKCNVKLLEKETKHRFRLTLIICDGTAEAYATVFGTCLEEFFGCTAAYLHR